MTIQVHRWPVPIDDHDHQIGGGDVVLVATKDGALNVWTRELLDTPDDPRHVRVYATGQDIPAGLPHLGSTINLPFEWHVFTVADAYNDWRTDGGHD